MALNHARRLLKELIELDQGVKAGGAASASSARRAAIAAELSAWALKASTQRSSDQREHPRAAIRLRVHLGSGTEVVTDNLGVGGLSLMLKFRPVKDERLELRIVLPPPDGSLLVSARVAWVDQATGRTGLQFLDLPPEMKVQLERIVLTSIVEGG